MNEKKKKKGGLKSRPDFQISKLARYYRCKYTSSSPPPSFVIARVMTLWQTESAASFHFFFFTSRYLNDNAITSISGGSFGPLLSLTKLYVSTRWREIWCLLFWLLVARYSPFGNIWLWKRWNEKPALLGSRSTRFKRSQKSRPRGARNQKE